MDFAGRKLPGSAPGTEIARYSLADGCGARANSQPQVARNPGALRSARRERGAGRRLTLPWRAVSVLKVDTAGAPGARCVTFRALRAYFATVHGAERSQQHFL